MQLTPPSHWKRKISSHIVSKPFHAFPEAMSDHKVGHCCPCLVQTCSNHFKSQRYWKYFILFETNIWKWHPNCKRRKWHRTKTSLPWRSGRGLTSNIYIHQLCSCDQGTNQRPWTEDRGHPRTMNQIDQVKSLTSKNTASWNGSFWLRRQKFLKQ